MSGYSSASSNATARNQQQTIQSGRDTNAIGSDAGAGVGGSGFAGSSLASGAQSGDSVRVVNISQTDLGAIAAGQQLSSQSLSLAHDILASNQALAQKSATDSVTLAHDALVSATGVSRDATDLSAHAIDAVVAQSAGFGDELTALATNYAQGLALTTANATIVANNAIATLAGQNFQTLSNGNIVPVLSGSQSVDGSSLTNKVVIVTSIIGAIAAVLYLAKKSA